MQLAWTLHHGDFRAEIGLAPQVAEQGSRRPDQWGLQRFQYRIEGRGQATGVARGPVQELDGERE